MSISNHNIQKTDVLKGMSFCLIFVCAILATANYFKNQNIYVITSELFLCLFSIYCYCQLRKNKQITVIQYALPYSYFFVVILATNIFGVYSNVMDWTFTFPVLAYVLFGLRQGTTITAGLLLIQSISYFQQYTQQVNWLYGTYLNFVLPYAVVWTISFAYEYSQNKTKLALIRLAMRDPLTDAQNRLALKEKFKHQGKPPVESFISVIDVDHFKKVNDAYGHEAGDIVLQELVSVMKHIFNDEDVYRLGGEEFCIIINGHYDEAYLKLNQLLLTVENYTFSANNLALNITISIGFSEMKLNSSLSESLKLADQHLYSAKAQGRNCIVTK